jgi:hypothetical protein
MAVIAAIDGAKVGYDAAQAQCRVLDRSKTSTPFAKKALALYDAFCRSLEIPEFYQKGRPQKVAPPRSVAQRFAQRIIIGFV